MLKGQVDTAAGADLVRDNPSFPATGRYIKGSSNHQTAR